jgi:hypothetical protein
MSGRERALRAGWRLDETCQCAEPETVFAGGDGYFVNRVCLRCRARVPK